MNPADKETERLLREMEKKIRKEYKQAIDEVEEKLDDYIRRFKIKDEKWRQWVEEGKKTKQEYQAWRTGQIAMGNRWRAVRERLAKVYANADMAARSTVLGFLPEVYALNHNWGTYEIEHELGIDTSYSLYNAEAVERLMRDDPQMLPPPGQATQKRIREGKAELWNNKQIQSVMIQSILQGEAITKIATRLATTVGDRDRAAAIRNARTMTIGAMNAGRVDSYLRAESMGIKLKQQWVAALDMRTRVSHRHLDGVTVAVGTKFPNGCRFPGDPDGAPSEIYNCFVGETYVSTDSEVHRVYSHKYEGELVTIKSAGGIKFTCTPNHPILTMRGWVPAKLLNDRDNILVAFVSKDHCSRWNPNINHAFASFNTAREFIDKPHSERASALSVNFHGDIPASDVEIITEKRFLRSGGDSCKFENEVELRFEETNTAFAGGGTVRKHLLAIWATAFGYVRSVCESLAFFWWRLRHSEIHGLRPVALLDASGVKPLENYSARDVKFLSECLDGFSGVVFADNIVSVDFDSRCTHVYNLQSENGYYFVNESISQNKGSNNDIGVIAHNCRCSLRAAVEGFEPDASDLSLRPNHKLKNMSYAEWKRSKNVKTEPILRPDYRAKAAKWSYLKEYMTL